MKIGIIGAMYEEVSSLLREMEIVSEHKQGKRTFYEGELYGKSVVLVFSRWGKVAAATTVTQLICDFQVDLVVFTGIAGALSSKLKIGDIVIGRHFYQHDMDARPLMKQYEIPLVGKTYFEADAKWVERAVSASQLFVEQEADYIKSLAIYGIEAPLVYSGGIASGDLFVSSEEQKNKILSGLPDVLCVEMEGAAVAQVCDDFDIPLVVIRSISDTADDQAYIDFPVYLEKVAAEYAHYILKILLQKKCS